MRKILSISLLAVYGLLSLGLNFSMHYCQGKLKNVEVFGVAQNCCGEDEGADECSFNFDCCSNNDFRLAIDDAHQSLKVLENLNITPTFIPQGSAFIASFDSDSSQSIDQIRGSPPWVDEDTYLTYCRLIVYG